jgi:hypothetical protein
MYVVEEGVQCPLYHKEKGWWKMSEKIKRYDSPLYSMRESSAGAYVSFNAYASLRAELTETKKEVAELVNQQQLREAMLIKACDNWKERAEKTESELANLQERMKWIAKVYDEFGNIKIKRNKKRN